MSSPTRPQIREALRTLVADKRYRDHNHPEHDAYVAHVTGEFKRVYPGKYEPGSSRMYANDPEGGPESIVHVRSYSQSRSGNVVQVSDYDRAAPGKGGGHRMPKHMKPTNEPIRPSDYYRDLGFDPNGPEQGEVARQHPLDAWRAKKMADDSIEAAKIEYDDEYSLKHGEGDAFRHGLWSYRMAKELGADRAKEFGDAHEVSVINNDGDRVKDIFNNAAGRELALDPTNHGKPDIEVIKQAIRQGKLQIEPFNAPGPIQPTWGR